MWKSNCHYLRIPGDIWLYLWIWPLRECIRFLGPLQKWQTVLEAGSPKLALLDWKQGVGRVMLSLDALGEVNFLARPTWDGWSVTYNQRCFCTIFKHHMLSLACKCIIPIFAAVLYGAGVQTCMELVYRLKNMQVMTYWMRKHKPLTRRQQVSPTASQLPLEEKWNPRNHFDWSAVSIYLHDWSRVIGCGTDPRSMGLQWGGGRAESRVARTWVLIRCLWWSH